MARILLVEDNPKVVYRVRKILEPEWTLVHAPRLSEALGMLRTGDMALVLLDLTLPDGRGADLVSMVSALAPEVPLIALLDGGDEISVVDLIQRGAQDYLVKQHLAPEMLVARLRHALGQEALPVPPQAPSERDLAQAVTPTRHDRTREPVPESRFKSGDRIGNYVIERLLGDGGMGTVYLARQLSLGRKVAVKLLAERFTHDAHFVKRFDREAAVLSNLSHPNIVTIFDKGVQGARFYFVMEYVDGVSLREILTRAKFNAEQVLRTAMVLCEALEYAHDQGVVHRDIKPENLIFTRAGQLKVTDFGLARIVQGQHAVGSPITHTGTLMGTQDYMAPEARHSGKHVDSLSDIYSMGVILYEMLSGELPVGRFDPPSAKSQGDDRVDAIVMKALESDPAKRYQRASDMGRDLAQLIRHHGPSRSGFVPLRYEAGRKQERASSSRIAYPSRRVFTEGAGIQIPP